MDARHLSRMEKEFSSYDLTEHLMSQKLQMNNFNHGTFHLLIPHLILLDQSVHHPAQDMEHLLEPKLQ